MRLPDGKQSDTRERLLRSAAGVFAEKGYRKTTIAEICEAAEANIAAVNYHFGSKENLYVEAWRHSLAQSLEAYPPDGGVSPEAPTEDRLRGRIRALVARAMDDDCAEFEIMCREIVSPTGLLFKVAKEAIGPLREAFQQIIEELLGSAVPKHVAYLCALSVTAPCIHMVHRRRMIKFLGEENLADVGHLDETLDHMVRFALGGIRAVHDYHASASPTAQEDSRDD
jgi:TetR/AcrR family transcriptional regulator, regulator of cefoperazone and chloramphenicol sensitivity